MGFPTKIQLIKREKSEQWYINFPAAVAQAMEFEKGEVVEWVIEDKKKMVLKRSRKEIPPEKKNSNNYCLGRFRGNIFRMRGCL